MRSLVIGVLLVLGCATAAADPPPEVDLAPPRINDPDTQAARRHFDHALTLYDRNDYANAVFEFQEAQKLRPSPKLDYNIGRCFDRMERWGEAAAAYSRFVDAFPDAPEAPELRERIAVLKGRVPKKPPAYKRWWPWTILGVGLGAGLAVGLGLGLTRHHFDRTIPDLGPGVVTSVLRIRF